MPGATHALQPPRHRLRALDLDHEVDRAHVDPELEGRGRDEARDAARLQELLDLHALLAGERAVVGPGELLPGELVQAQREPLREAPVVDEHDRRAVLADELEDRRVDRRPDRAARLLDARPHLHPVRERRDREVRRRAELAHVLERDDDLEVELLADPASTSSISRPVPATNRPISASGRWVAESPIRWNGPSTIRSRRSSESARCAPRFVPATECTSSRITVSIPRSVSRACEVRSRNSALGRGDEDVGRRAQHPPPLVGRRVAGAHRDGELRAQARERAAQVPLDVVVERLERGDVEEAEARARGLVQAVDPDEERGERLPGAGRRLDQDVPAARDRGPAELLGGSRAREGALEPLPRPRGEDVECAHEVEGTSVVVGCARALRRRRRGGRHCRVRARRAAEREPRPPRLPGRGRPRLRAARGRPLAGRDPRRACPPVGPRLGHRGRGRALPGRPRPRRLVGGQRVHGGRRLARRLRRVGARAGRTRTCALPRARGLRAPDGAVEHGSARTASSRLPRRRAGRRLPAPPRSERPRRTGRRRPVPGERRRRTPLERGVRLPRSRPRPAQPVDRRRDARRPGRPRPVPGDGSSPRTAACSRRRSCCSRPGAYFSPAILARSGVGPRSRTCAGSASPIVESLPVGERLLDHCGTDVAWDLAPLLQAETDVEACGAGLFEATRS